MSAPMEIDAFLAQAGWGGAAREPLAGDASARSYQRLTLLGKCAVLMVTPLGCADDPAQFLTIATHLARLGLSPPRCLAQDLPRGLLLLEDLGDAVFARILAQDPAQESQLYSAAAQVLDHIHANPAPPNLPDLSAADWAEAAMLAARCYGAEIRGHSAGEADLQSALTEAILRHADGPRVMILRDYHAENLMHLPQRTGLERVGLLDFQLAQMGQRGYDLVSLLQDARRDVSAGTSAALLGRARAASGQAEADFSAAIAVIGAQRALRILGIFARLCTQQGKPAYLPLIPRVWGHLQQNLSHPALADLRAICEKHLPAPSAAVLQTLGSKCKSHL